MSRDSRGAMRVLMLNNEFPPLGGGTGTVNRAVLEHFAGVPWLEIDLLTSGLQREEEERFAERIRILKLPVSNRNIHHSSNRELLTYAARAFACGRRLQQIRPYDICFAWSAVPAGGVALALRGLTGLRYLVRVCGPDIPGFERRYRWLYPMLSPAIRAVWRSAELVVAKCAGEAEMIRAVDGTVPVTLVPNAVDASAFRPGAGIPDTGPLRVLCVGRLIERKGQHHLIEALRRLVKSGVDLRLELVGTGDAAGQYQIQASSCGIEDRVLFSGYVAREDMPERYARAHVFVLPSYNEGMSVATLEAMAAGLPLVVSRTGGTAELVEEGVNGLMFEWGDVAELAKHLERLALDRALARSMARASRARSARYSWRSTVDEYTRILQQLVDLPQAAATGVHEARPVAAETDPSPRA